MFSSFALEKCSVNHPLPGRPTGEDKQVGKSERNSGVLVVKYFDHCILRYFDIGTILC